MKHNKMNGLEEKIDAIVERLATVEIKYEKLERDVKNLKELFLDANIVEVFLPITTNPEYFISSFGRAKRKRDGYFCKINIDGGGYQQVTLSGKTYKIHRLVAEAFLPNPENKKQVDHINGDKLDNHISNLRWATVQENTRNRKTHKNNTSGFRGVSYHKEAGKYRAQIMLDNGKNKYLGLYPTAEEASQVYEQAAKESFGEFYREL